LDELKTSLLEKEEEVT